MESDGGCLRSEPAVHDAFDRRMHHHERSAPRSKITMRGEMQRGRPVWALDVGSRIAMICRAAHRRCAVRIEFALQA